MIAKQEQGKKLGLAMLHGLNEIAEKVCCYKVRIACDMTWVCELTRDRLSSIVQLRMLHSTRSVAFQRAAMRCNITSTNERKNIVCEILYCERQIFATSVLAFRSLVV